jgi:hypothetical protein
MVSEGRPRGHDGRKETVSPTGREVLNAFRLSVFVLFHVGQRLGVEKLVGGPSAPLNNQARVEPLPRHSGVDLRSLHTSGSERASAVQMVLDPRLFVMA